jgi:hypothetical protein
VVMPMQAGWRARGKAHRADAAVFRLMLFSAGGAVRVTGLVPSAPAPWADTHRHRRVSRCR